MSAAEKCEKSLFFHYVGYCLVYPVGGVSDALLVSLACQIVQPCGIGAELLCFIYDKLVRKILLLDNDGSASFAEHHCVVILMISRNHGGGDKNGSTSHCFKLAYGRSSAAADDKVGCCSAYVHVVDVLLDHELGVCLGVDAHFFKALYKGTVTHLP